ncbi:MAG: Hsp33 family molecular chaperone HslO [Betaproteobacteria bacterium]|nr:Hsp33 family molecular chaperone HslO [Betaproteobacteria bacterium]
MFQDYLFYGTDVETRYAFRMLHLTSLVRQAQAMHGLVGAEAELLGQGLLSGVLLASILEDEERINLRFHSGNNCTMGVETTRHAVTRGYLETNAESALVRQLKEGRSPVLPWVVRSLRSRSGTSQLFEGISGTETHSLEVAVNAHLETSYQMKTQVRVDCWHSPKDGQLYAAGVIYLELPNLKPEISQQLWQHVEALPPFRELFGEGTHDPDQVSAKLIPHQVRAINSMNPSWGCTCSKESVESMLKKLGHDELVTMADEGKPAEVRCHYCNKNFNVEVARLRQLAQELLTADQSSSSTVLN